jgi:hypothetical protein
VVAGKGTRHQSGAWVPPFGDEGRAIDTTVVLAGRALVSLPVVTWAGGIGEEWGWAGLVSFEPSWRFYSFFLFFVYSFVPFSF